MVLVTWKLKICLFQVTLRFTSDDNEVVIINHLREEVNMNNIFMFYKLITSTSIS